MPHTSAETLRRGVAKHFHAEKMAGEGSRSIPTLKKWSPRGRRGGEIPPNVILNLFQDLTASLCHPLTADRC